MTKHHVQQSKAIASVSAAWTYVRDFGSDWHPDITSSTLSVDVTGALKREFISSDGNTYCEQRTYFSDTDKRLRYSLTNGIPGALHYDGEAAIVDESVQWTATFEAEAPAGKAIASGTDEIFKNGLNWLNDNAKIAPEITPETNSYRAPTQKAKLHHHIVSCSPNSTSPKLSVISSMPPDQPCSTLVLFLHGIGGNATNWEAQLSAFGQSYTIAALDFRGYGNSEPGDKQTHIEDHCTDILRVMSHFGARKLVLVGLSMGSWIATSFAMRYPQLLAGLVLAGGCTGMSEADTQECTRFRESRSIPLSEGKKPADFADDVVNIIAGPQITKSQRKALHQSMSAISSDTYLDALVCFTNPVEKFDFSRITCAVLLITGEHDLLAPPDEIRQISLRMFDDIRKCDRLPDICFEVIPGAGHLCNLENPEACNTLLNTFLSRITEPPATKLPNRELRRQVKSKLIIDAALKEFSAQGFDGVSMTSIANRAGVSKPTLYQYFDDKDGLFSAVLQDGCEHITTPLSTPDGSLVDRLWNFSWVYADFVLRPDMLSLARLVLGEASRRPEVAEAYHLAGPGKAFKGLIAFIEECVEAGQMEVDDVEYAAQDLWSLILSGPRDHHLHFVKERPDSDQLLRSISHGLRVFLKAYSTNVKHDLAALDLKKTKLDQPSKTSPG